MSEQEGAGVELIKQLRALSEPSAAQLYDDGTMNLLREAADEIDRLRALRSPDTAADMRERAAKVCFERAEKAHAEYMRTQNHDFLIECNEADNCKSAIRALPLSSDSK